ncbi:MAG TPA: hypothetical protein VKN99_01235 [Polyangia bacterium]|nr:hypothetical protein [Polyangia bacterium]
MQEALTVVFTLGTCLVGYAMVWLLFGPRKSDREPAPKRPDPSH